MSKQNNKLKNSPSQRRQQVSKKQQNQHKTPNPGPSSKSTKRDILLREILSLGGGEEDLDLLHDALSDDERGVNVNVKGREKEKKGEEVDENSLLRELRSFMKGDLKIDPAKSRVLEVDDGEVEEEGVEEEGVEEGEGKEEGNEEDGELEMEGQADEELHEDEDDAIAKYGKEDASQVADMVSQMLKGQKVDDKLSKKLLLEPVSQWYTVPLPPLKTKVHPSTSEEIILSQYTQAQSLHKAETEKYQKTKSISSADKDFISTILKSGTVTDKVSALTLLIQESPVHTLHLLRDQLVNGMARKKARREAVMAIDSVKDLLLGTLLPDRKLRYFRDQPLSSPDIKPVHLIQWYFEDSLKKTYFEFIQLLEDLSRDPLPHIKNKMIQYIHDLLSTKPEQESNLLSLLVNKLGDQDRKLASKSAYLLSKLLVQHPAMNVVVIKEVERLVFRSNVSERARYYAITFLNQIVLSSREKDVEAANRLVGIYFAVFEELGKKARMQLRDEDKKKNKANGKAKTKGTKGKKGAKNDPKSKDTKEESKDESLTILADGISTKMMSALLTGVNRAFPFTSLPPTTFTTHLNTLFTTTHTGPFNLSIQSLTLIYQIQSSHHSLSDRFYRTLYSTLLDPRLHSSSKQAMYLNLLYRALKSDVSLGRVCAFLKRLVQGLTLARVEFVCAGLFLVGEVARGRPGVWGMVLQGEERDGVERFVDVVEDGDVPQEQQTEVISDEPKYDGKKRDPLHAHASSSSFWDLVQFTTHYHPTVSLYAHTLLTGTPISPPKNATAYDPLQNHTLARFLDRFVFKNPKKLTSVYRGESLMQPRVGPRGVGGERIVGGGKKRGGVVVGEGGQVVKLDDGVGEGVDEGFLRVFMEGQGKEKKGRRKRKGKGGDGDDEEEEEEIAEVGDIEGEEEEEEEMDEDEVWDAMRKSVGFEAVEVGSEDDDDDDDDDLDMEMEMGESDADDDDELDIQPSDEVQDQMPSALASDEDEGISSSDEMTQWATIADSDEDDIPLPPSTFDSDAEDVDDKEKESDKKKKKGKKNKLAQKAAELGYRGSFFDAGSGGGLFAGVEEFEGLLRNEGGDEEGGKRKRGVNDDKRTKGSKRVKRG